jgi:hypothetical protein
MKPDELQGDARRMFFTLRGLGLSEAAAMQQLEHDGIVEKTSSRESTAAVIARAFGRAPENVREAAAPGAMTLAEARAVLSARTFGHLECWGEPLTPVRVAEAERVRQSGADVAKPGASPLVTAVEREADRLLTEHRTWGRGNALQEAWAARFREMTANRAGDQALKSLDEAMQKAYPKLSRHAKAPGTGGL